MIQMTKAVPFDKLGIILAAIRVGNSHIDLLTH